MNYNANALMNRLGEDDPLGLPKPKNGNTGVTGLAGQAPSLDPGPMNNLPNGGMEQMPRILEPGQTPSLSMTPGGTAAPAPPALGAFGNKLEGFDAGKLSSGHDSPKYQFGRVMSQFDPKGGITQAMLDQLNGLGLGTVSGSVGGDKISVGGNVDPRFQGVTEFDVIRDLENGGGWQWDAGAAAPQAAGGAPPSGVPINALLQGDPNRAILNAQGGFGEQSAMLKALMAQLQG